MSVQLGEPAEHRSCDGSVAASWWRLLMGWCCRALLMLTRYKVVDCSDNICGVQ